MGVTIVFCPSSQTQLIKMKKGFAVLVLISCSISSSTSITSFLPCYEKKCETVYEELCISLTDCSHHPREDCRQVEVPCPRDRRQNHQPRSLTYDCKSGVGSACQWTNYTENVDWGYYSKVNGDCSWCQSQCSNDLNCWAVECGQGYCSWWKNGQCSYEDAQADEYYNANYETCRSQQDQPGPRFGFSDNNRGGRLITSLPTVARPENSFNDDGVCNYKCGSRTGECQHEYRSSNGLYIIGNCVVHGIVNNEPRCLGVHPQCSRCIDKCVGLESMSFSETPKQQRPRVGRIFPAEAIEKVSEPALYGSEPTRASREPKLYGQS